jgi:two-component system nitrogen regulation sensor histidine kinase NtrY
VRLGLRGRLTLAFLLLVGFLTGGTSWLLYRHAGESFRQDFGDRVAAARDAVSARLQRDADILHSRTKALASDPRVAHLEQDLDHDRYDRDPAVRKRLIEDARALLSSADLDVLWILDGQSGRRVLAAPHRAGEQEPGPTLSRYLNRGAVGHVVAIERVNRNGRPLEVPVLEVGVVRHRVQLIAGRVVGQAVAEDIRTGAPDLEVTIRAPDGHVVASTLTDAEPPAQPAGYETERVVIRNATEESTALTVDVHVSRAPLERRLRGVFRATAFVGGSAAVLALLLGWLLARRITSPLVALVQATQRLAAGEREIELPRGRRDEVGDLVTAFSGMAEELEASETRLRRSERVAAWQDIARELAHEIKNPLTPIQMAIETVRRTKARNHPSFDEVFEESTTTILEEVDRLKTIVTEFSQFARMPRPNPHPASLNELVHHTVVLYREEEGVQVTEQLDTEIPELLLDSDRLKQVIQNLLKNAIQATRAGDGPGRVRVATRMTPEWVEVVIEDNGCGIAEEDLPRVFTPYFTSKAGGTGLGLAVVHRIVTGHEGRIGVQSTIGEGTRFIVQLPLAPA